METEKILLPREIYGNGLFGNGMNGDGIKEGNMEILLNAFETEALQKELCNKE